MLWRTTIMARALALSSTTSPLRTVYDGIVTRRPFTFTWPWRTSWRAWERLAPQPARNATLSSRSSSMRSRFSPVTPFWRFASWYRLRNCFSSRP
jgi:hypothetical protein